MMTPAVNTHVAATAGSAVSTSNSQSRELLRPSEPRMLLSSP
jgi:hypothetical protein